VRPAAAARRKALASIGLETSRAIHLGLRPGDERRQPIDAVADGNHRLRLRLRLKLRLRPMLALIVFAGLLILFARLVGLRIPWLFPLWIARHERLLLDRDKARFGAEIRKTLAVVVAVLRGHFIVGTWLRLVLAELFLGGRDQPEIMLGVLIVILRRHGVAGTSRIARQLDVFFRDVVSHGSFIHQLPMCDGLEPSIFCFTSNSPGEPTRLMQSRKNDYLSASPRMRDPE